MNWLIIMIISFHHITSCYVILCYVIVGTIDAKELKVAMRALGFEPKKEEIKKMISGKIKI